MKIRCPKCGHSFEADSLKIVKRYSFCAECGHRFLSKGTDSSLEQEASDPERISFNGLVLNILFGVLCLISVALSLIIAPLFEFKLYYALSGTILLITVFYVLGKNFPLIGYLFSLMLFISAISFFIILMFQKHDGSNVLVASEHYAVIAVSTILMITFSAVTTVCSHYFQSIKTHKETAAKNDNPI